MSETFALRPIHGIRKFFYYYKMILFGSLYASLIAVCSTAIIFGLPLIKFKSTKKYCRKYTYACLRQLLLITTYLNRALNTSIQINGTLDFDKNQSHLLICNHQSWVDIILIMSCLQAHLPPLKFFPKKELKKFPFIGLVCTAMGNPFIDRKNRERAVDSIRSACEEFKGEPASYIIYVEGTRFSPKKKKIQTKNHFRHLLLPRSRGMSVTLQALNDLKDIIDITIVFPAGCSGLPDYLGGRVSQIKIFVQVRPITPELRDLASSTNEAATRLTEWWQEKDQLIEDTQSSSSS